MGSAESVTIELQRAVQWRYQKRSPEHFQDGVNGPTRSRCRRVGSTRRCSPRTLPTVTRPRQCSRRIGRPSPSCSSWCSRTLTKTFMLLHNGGTHFISTTHGSTTSTIRRKAARTRAYHHRRQYQRSFSNQRPWQVLQHSNVTRSTLSRKAEVLQSFSNSRSVESEHTSFTHILP